MNENCLEMSALSVCKAADAITKLSRAQYSISVLSEEIINSSQTVKDIDDAISSMTNAIEFAKKLKKSLLSRRDKQL